jgi:hypothetical protein
MFIVLVIIEADVALPHVIHVPQRETDASR